MGIHLRFVLHSYNIGMKKAGEPFFCIGIFVKQRLFNRFVIGIRIIMLLLTIITEMFISIVKHLVNNRIVKEGVYGEVLYIDSEFKYRER